MKNQMLLYYDEEGDFLEIMVGRPTKGYVVDIKPGIFQRVDEKTGKITGIAILGFKKTPGKKIPFRGYEKSHPPRQQRIGKGT